MKCSSQVSPLWKNPTAKGPWYQVLSKPVMPVDSLPLASSVKWMTAIAATTNAINTARSRPSRRREVVPTHTCRVGRGRPPSGGRGTTRHSPRPVTATRTKYGTGSHQPKLQQLRRPDQQRQCDHSRRQMRWRALEARQQPSAQRGAAEPGESAQQQDLGDPQQVPPRPEHPPLAAPPQQAAHLLQLGYPQQL